jgi:hypothetical protein
MKLLVGCPTRNRTWILEEWREHVERATPGDWDLQYVFVVGIDDRETIEMLRSWPRTQIIYVEEPDPGPKRSWGSVGRYDHMVFLRNTMLSKVRYLEPDLFLSLDSDILIGQDTIRDMYETLVDQEFDAIGGVTWLDPVDPYCTNVANWTSNQMKAFKRVQSSGHHAVDVIMAIKLMTPAAYNVDYCYHFYGEDLGWNKNMFLAKKRIGMDGRTPSKHVMSPDWLLRKDKRVGW